jgi:hypothetical protein
MKLQERTVVVIGAVGLRNSFCFKNQYFLYSHYNVFTHSLKKKEKHKPKQENNKEHVPPDSSLILNKSFNSQALILNYCVRC